MTPLVTHNAALVADIRQLIDGARQRALMPLLDNQEGE